MSFCEDNAIKHSKIDGKIIEYKFSQKLSFVSKYTYVDGKIVNQSEPRNKSFILPKGTKIEDIKSYSFVFNSDINKKRNYDQNFLQNEQNVKAFFIDEKQDEEVIVFGKKINDAINGEDLKNHVKNTESCIASDEPYYRDMWDWDDENAENKENDPKLREVLSYNTCEPIDEVEEEPGDGRELITRKYDINCWDIQAFISWSWFEKNDDIYLNLLWETAFFSPENNFSGEIKVTMPLGICLQLKKID